MAPTRLLRLEDAPALAELLRTNRDFLAPWDPVRDGSYFSDAGQESIVRSLLESHAAGVALPHVILNPSGRIVGRITLSNIIRGAFQSCHLGYWVSAQDNGRGYATAAVGNVTRVAFEELGLHRIEAGTLLHNERSQRVLERNGFTRFGVAPMYLEIAGSWQDHALYQVLNPGP